MKPEIQAKIAALYAVIGRDSDPFRILWSRADHKTRALLAKVGGCSSLVAYSEWDALRPETRHKIKHRSADLRDWLNRVLGEQVEAVA